MRKLKADATIIERLAHIRDAMQAVEFNMQAIEKQIGIKHTEAPAITIIRDAVAKAHGLHPSDLNNNSKRYAVCHPRQLGLALSRALTGLTYEAIAEAFNQPDHGTAIHAVKAVSDRCSTDAAFNNLYLMIRAEAEKRLIAAGLLATTLSRPKAS